MSIGFVGLGIMGSAMAGNLLKAGFGVTVWNRTPGKCQALATSGATVASYPREVAAASEIVFAMMADPAAAAAVNELFKKAMSDGLGAEDFSAVSRVIRAME